MAEKLLIVDVDETLRDTTDFLFNGGRYGRFNTRSVMLLQRTCQYSGAKLATNSSYFNALSAKAKPNFYGYMATGGFDTTLIHEDWTLRTTEQDGYRPRGDLHDRYMERHPDITHSAVLDDEKVLRNGKPHPNWVLVQEHLGLNVFHILKALALLDANPDGFHDFCAARPVVFTPTAHKV